MNDDPVTVLREDPHLGPVVAEHGELTLEPAEDFFKRFIASILSQQVSIASAAAIEERLYDTVTVEPEPLLQTETETLREIGLSRQKADYVQNIAEAFIDNGYSLEYFEEMDDGAVITELTSIKGVGTWTAKMQLMFSLGRGDVFPVEDLGVRKGMTALYTDDLTWGEMEERAENWRPYRSYASLYLWKAYDD